MDVFDNVDELRVMRWMMDAQWSVAKVHYDDSGVIDIGANMCND